MGALPGCRPRGEPSVKPIATGVAAPTLVAGLIAAVGPQGTLEALIEAERDGWILGFDGKSLGNPPAEAWQVKRDGGVFDQFTGATITPRAVIKAVRNSLLY